MCEKLKEIMRSAPNASEKIIAIVDADWHRQYGNTGRRHPATWAQLVHETLC
ncbi:MAG: hypothetical protein PHH26_01905 [Candidatus Thermoplasmatota archaeon]|nr:hypothetical protein [Candidatus Thermoplasmatota archaeon]